MPRTQCDTGFPILNDAFANGIKPRPEMVYTMADSASGSTVVSGTLAKVNTEPNSAEANNTDR